MGELGCWLGWLAVAVGWMVVVDDGDKREDFNYINLFIYNLLFLNVLVFKLFTYLVPRKLK
ncbi:hypothetical protein Hanom_Chr06g00533141 [Helianthus anomalus]